jgi:hypothetical protein
MVDEPAPSGPTTAEQPVTNRTLHSEFLAFFRRQFGGNVLALVIVGGSAVLGAWRAVAGEARAQADAGVLPVAIKVEDLDRRVKRVEDQTVEVQADIRALYKAVMTGRPQERLEQPAPRGDAGP